MANSIYPPSNLDANQVLQHSYDDDKQRLRVDVGAEINLDGAVEVSLKAPDDKVTISDGTNDLKINPDGSIDVNAIVDLDLPTTPGIANIETLLANTEYSYQLPIGTRSFLIKARNGKMRLSFTSGGTNTTYLTIDAGCNYVVDNIKTSSIIYFQSTKSNNIIEINTWI
jgi:hypothetical protein